VQAGGICRDGPPIKSMPYELLQRQFIQSSNHLTEAGSTTVKIPGYRVKGFDIPDRDTLLSFVMGTAVIRGRRRYAGTPIGSGGASSWRHSSGSVEN
jgi:hypothetical protein